MLVLRAVAAALAILGILPLWRILPQRATGIAGLATADAAASYSALIWNGVLLALIPAVLAALLFDSARMEAALQKVTAPLTRARPLVYASAIALLATLLAAIVAVGIMHGRPTLIDSFAQLLQARYLAAGHLGGPVSSAQPAWHIQQTITTAHGWVTQYPPGYMLLLALGFLLHAPELVGPMMFGVAAFFTALIADEVITDRALARAAALLAAISPFMLGMAGAFMSHVPACAFTSAALYCVLRSRAGDWRWSVGAGLSIGLLFAVRPLTAMVAGVVAIGYALTAPLSVQQKTRAIAGAFLAALPMLLLVGFYNAHFFGGFTTFGYTRSLGPHGAMGFGTDPWGNTFGPVEALAYTSAELTALNVFLLEVPLPLTLFIGLYFALRARSLTSGAILTFVWVAALVLANLYYWHHGLFMGPRMLADAGTLWVLLAVMSVAGLIASIRADWEIAGKYSVRAFATGGVLAMLLVGIFVFAPQRLMSYEPSAGTLRLLDAPHAVKPSLVFVHGGWTARVAMRLAGSGMRLDSVETALRQNGTCSAHKFSLAYAAHTPLPPLDFSTEPVRPTETIELAPGDRMRVTKGEVVDADCSREMASDSAGVVDVSPYIWQGDLPGLTGNGAMFVRDMGPASNAQVIEQQRGRTPFMLVERNDGMVLEPYAPAAARIWHTSVQGAQ